MSRAIDIEHRKRSDRAPADDARAPTRHSGAPAVMVCGAEGTGKTTLIGALAKSARHAGESTPENEISPSFATAGGRVALVEAHWDDAELHHEATSGPPCDFSLLLTDTRRGVNRAARRSAYILSLLGVGNVALVVNQMDVADFSQERFDQISSEFRGFAEQLDFKDITCIPVSSLTGDNLIARGAAMGWYHGPTVTEHLESVTAALERAEMPFRMAVREIVEITPGLSGCAGTLAGGVVHPGDGVVALPVGRETRIEKIVGGEGERSQACGGDAVTLVLSDAIGIAAGHMLASPDAPAEVSDQIAAHVIWTGTEPMLPGRSYVLKAGGQKGMATVTALKHKINLDNLDHIAGPTLERDEIGFCNLSIEQPIVFDPCKENGETGRFVLFDRLSGERVGDGLIEFGLRRATNISWQALDIDKHARAGRKSQRPCVLWFTGLSGAGKSTLANLLEKRLHARGQHTYVLDGDNVRHGLSKDLGFTDADRVENIRRVAETAKLMVDAGLIVMASFISPFRSERRMARELFDDGEFIEIFVDTPLAICEQRDPKGLYEKARAGLIKNFTGIDSDYESPEKAEITLDAGDVEPDRLIGDLIAELEKRGFI